jgi:hypothetical protein
MWFFLNFLYVKKLYDMLVYSLVGSVTEAQEFRICTVYLQKFLNYITRTFSVKNIFSLQVIAENPSSDRRLSLLLM